MKVYAVQTWDGKGALTNSYEATMPNAKALEQLRAFLKKHHAHIEITPVPTKRRRG